MIDLAPPALLLIIGAFLVPLLPARIKSIVLLGLPLLALVWIWSLPINSLEITVADGAHRFNLFMLGRLFATVFAILSFVGNLFALRHARTLEFSAGLFYAGSAIGVVLSTNFMSLLIFWELMVLGSTLIIFAAGTPAATAAGIRYFIIHALSGVLLLTGVVGLFVNTGDLTLRALTTDTVYAWLILASFLINAGAPPLSAWISDAYPEASASGTVYLSAFTTKAAVFTLLVVFAGEFILIPLGVYMIFYGIIYALMENDMRRILTYSIVNQVGFMVVGIGIGTALALNGAALHAFTHIIYKALLMMSAGSVLVMTGRRHCTELGGLYRSMRLTTICAIIGALSISAFPLTSGFISKPMVTQSALDIHWLWLWLLLYAASAGVFLHAGIKFPWFVFFQKDSGLRPTDPAITMQIAMVLLAAFCVLIGIFPQLLYSISPWQLDYVPYTQEHVVETLQLLLFSGVAFFVMLPWLKRTQTISLDTDWIYRKCLSVWALRLAARIGTLNQAVYRFSAGIFHISVQCVITYCRHNQLLTKNAHSSILISWLIGLLIVFLLIYY